jgi:hypothetical protein
MFLNRSLRMARNVGDFIQARVSLVAALKLGSPAITQALDIERVGELQQPVLRLGQRAKVGGRRALEPLSSLEGC